MPNLMQRGASWLGDRMQVAGGRTVTYRRAIRGGTSDTVSITAWPDSHVEETSDEGLETGFRIYNWTVLAADLVTNSVTFTPVEMDQIEETLNGESLVWQVCASAAGRPCFRWLDTAKTMLVVSTKQVIA